MSRIKTRKSLNTIALVHLFTNGRLSGITKMTTADYNVLQLNHKMLETLTYSSRKRKKIHIMQIFGFDYCLNQTQQFGHYLKQPPRMAY